MTVKNAIKMINYLMEAHLKNSAGMRKMVKDWTSDSKGLGIAIASTHEDVAKCLFLVNKELIPKCKHPKKMRDGKKGHRYCMKCNMDMDD